MVTKSQGRLSYWGEVILSVAIALLITRFWIYPSGQVTIEDMQFVATMLFLPIEFIILTIHTLATGREPRLGKTRFTLSRRALMLVLACSFALLGFLVGGERGFIIGFIAAGGIYEAIQYLRKKSQQPKLYSHKK